MLYLDLNNDNDIATGTDIPRSVKCVHVASNSFLDPVSRPAVALNESWPSGKFCRDGSGSNHQAQLRWTEC